MARTNAANITTNGTTKDQLAESYGNLIEAIQKGALSEKMKNTDYSGDPTTGSVEVDRFKNATVKDYGTARAAGKGDGLVNSGKTTINLDKDFEIVEELEEKDIRFFGIGDLIKRRVGNHAKSAIAKLDRDFFAEAESAGTAITLNDDVTAIEDVVEAVIQSIETTKNDWVDGVDRDLIEIAFTPAAYGKLRNYIDKVTVPTTDSGEEEVAMFHGVRVYSNVRQTKAIVAMAHGAVAQPVHLEEYTDEKINLSNSHAVELFGSYGTKAVMPDLIKTLEALPTEGSDGDGE